AGICDPMVLAPLALPHHLRGHASVPELRLQRIPVAAGRRVVPASDYGAYIERSERTMTNCRLETSTIGGLHDFLISQILPKYATGGKRALDLGAGSGALAVRLRDFGLDVLAADINAGGYRAPVPFVRLDLNDSGFARSLLTEGGFDLITAVEV